MTRMTNSMFRNCDDKVARGSCELGQEIVELNRWVHMKGKEECSKKKSNNEQLVDKREIKGKNYIVRMFIMAVISHCRSETA